MKVRCLYNTGEALRPFEYKSLAKGVLGRFGATGFSEYGGITLGQEYLVMGVIFFQTYQAYLIDDNGLISACPCQLFEIVDNKVSSNWRFRLIDKDENIYPFIQAIMGYPELCSNKNEYEDLIVEMEKTSVDKYFCRKKELTKEFNELS